MAQYLDPTNENEAVELGHKLGSLINALEVTDDIREALVTILPELTTKQLRELVDLLEASAIQGETTDLDLSLKQEVERIKKENDLAQDKLAAEADAELEKIAINLKP